MAQSEIMTNLKNTLTTSNRLLLPQSRWATFVLDAADRPHIACQDQNRLVYAHFADDAWQVEVVAEFPNAAYIYPLLELDQTGPYMAYRNPHTKLVQVAHRQPGGWRVTDVAALPAWCDLGREQLYLVEQAEAAAPLLLFRDCDDDPSTPLQLAAPHGDAWFVRSVLPLTGLTSILGATADAAGHLTMILHCGREGRRELYPQRDYERKRPHWNSLTLVQGSQRVQDNWTLRPLDLGLERSDWRPCYSFPPYAPYEAASPLTEFAWQPLTARLDPTGMVHMVWHVRAHYTAQDLVYTCGRPGQSAPWPLVTVDARAEITRPVSLALDPAGRPHMAYFERMRHALKYAWFDGGDWRQEVVDTAQLGPDMGMARWPEGRVSLCLDRTNRPHLLYCTTEDQPARNTYLVLATPLPGPQGWWIEPVTAEITPSAMSWLNP